VPALTLINDKKRPKPNYSLLYLNAFHNAAQRWALSPKNPDLIKKTIFAGIKYIGSSSDEKRDYEDIQRRFFFIQAISVLIATLTPAELLQLFPVIKKYDGKKYGEKDYFYTMDRLRKYGMDKIIGDEVFNILWDHTNHNLEGFMVEKLEVISDLRRAEGEPGLMEEFAEQNGITLSTLHTDKKGRMFLKDGQTGELRRVYKKRPRHMRVVKRSTQNCAL